MKKSAILFVMLILAASIAYAEADVFTDKTDYVEGEIVWFTGVNFAPDSLIDLFVSRPDDVELEFQTITDDTGSFTIGYYLDAENAQDGQYFMLATDGVNEAFGDFWDCGSCSCMKKIVKYIDGVKFYEENLKTGDKWIKEDTDLPSDGTVRVEYVNTCEDKGKKFKLKIEGLCFDSETGRPKNYPNNKMVAECSYTGASSDEELVVGLDVYACRRWKDVVEHTEVVYACDYECLEPTDLEADIDVFVGNEPSLRQILEDSGYYVDIENDQSNWQKWITTDSALVEITYLGSVAGNAQVFGYYLNSNPSTFVGLFEVGDHPDYSLPVFDRNADIGETFQVSLPADETERSFAIDSYSFGSGTSQMWFTETDLNPDDFQHTVVFDLCNEFLIGFEDLPESQADKDYQDIVFSLKLLDCVEEYTCVEAIQEGLLTGSITGGSATVTNNAFQDYDVGLAVYLKFDEDIENQVLFDSDTGTVLAQDTLDLSVDLPDCNYQIDLFCGDVIESFEGGVRYGNRKIDWEHNDNLGYCVEEACGNGILEEGEECDDGNTENGDGCSNICTIEECPDVSVTIDDIEVLENNEFTISYTMIDDDCVTVDGYLFPWPLVPDALNPEYILVEDLVNDGEVTVDMTDIYDGNEGYADDHTGFAFIPFCAARPDCDIELDINEDDVFEFDTPSVPEFTGMGLFLILMTVVVGYFAIFGHKK